MIIDILKHILRFFVLLVLQLFVLNNIQVNGYVNPYLYILFVMTLPFEAPIWIVLLSSFSMGILIDMFSNTPGYHASVSVFIAYIRKPILRFISPREGYESSALPTLNYLGFGWYMWYAGLMVFIHHFTFFFLEAFRFSEFFKTFWRVLASSFLTMLLILIYQYMTFRQVKNK
jgi:rod shape-determining protein MreD